VAAWIAQEEVQLILLQEVVGGLIAGTEESSEDLQEMLAQHGLLYDLQSSFETGVPGILEVKNAILSLCPILFSRSQTLSVVNEQTGDIILPVRREVTMVRIDLPDIGKVNVYNTHLCAGCEPEERLHQVDVLLAFVDEVEQDWGESGALILGGDFNIDATLPDEASRSAYAQLTEDLLDTYAELNACVDCCSVTDGFDGCTFGVPGNPFGDGTPQRIDYLFTREEVWLAVASQVVFNGMTLDDWVSDHAGVLTTLAVQGENVPMVSSR
jgi:maltose 6'-phosphate phosphatase